MVCVRSGEGASDDNTFYKNLEHHHQEESSAESHKLKTHPNLRAFLSNIQGDDTRTLRLTTSVSVMR